MAELEDKLNQILSNPDSMKKVMDLASGLMSAQKAGGSRSAEPQAPGPEGDGRDLGALLGSMAPGGGQSPPASGGWIYPPCWPPWLASEKRARQAAATLLRQRKSLRREASILPLCPG